MQRVLLQPFAMAFLLLTALFLDGGTLAQAQVKPEEDFAFTQSRQCINSSLPFGGPSGLQLQSGAFTSRTVNADRGVFRFNEDGTGTVTGRSTVINLNVFPLGIPVSESEFTGSFTWTETANGDVRIQATVNFQVVAGGGQGNTGTATGIDVRRLVVEDTVLLHAPAELPVVETLTTTTPDGTTSTTFRVCTRSGISMIRR